MQMNKPSVVLMVAELLTRFCVRGQTFSPSRPSKATWDNRRSSAEKSFEDEEVNDVRLSVGNVVVGGVISKDLSATRDTPCSKEAENLAIETIMSGPYVTNPALSQEVDELEDDLDCGIQVKDSVGNTNEGSVESSSIGMITSKLANAPITVPIIFGNRSGSSISFSTNGGLEELELAISSAATVPQKKPLIRGGPNPFVGADAVSFRQLLRIEYRLCILFLPPQPICYDGFEPSGRMHIAQGVMKTISVNKLTAAGCKVKIWIADWFAQLNNKMGGDLKKIQTVGRYLIEIWKAVGMDLEGDKVCSNNGSQTYKSFEELAVDYESGELHPGDLKPALSKAINEILQHLQNAGLYESQEKVVNREEVLGRLDQIVMNWVKVISRAKGLNEQLGQEANAKIFTFGSYWLGLGNWRERKN
ncbi:hypothetical protein JCGZ_07946 [Jatropha curcas]|uniref:tyrosine--tRNA ligase n=1 Tax=Jatropha curcas TaxID=180498 RepID=A0A067KZX5_JATCU|nr:hypothetical protein JCGZ_07946 [Jatropha curcas]